MSIRFNIFLLISFLLHFFVLFIVSFISESNYENNDYVKSINLEFSSFQKFDSVVNQNNLSMLKNSIETKEKNSKKLYTDNIVSTFAESYVSAWQRKAETIGNLNYPIFLKNNKNKVKLTLSVTIAKDGSLLDYVLINSSGNNTLDDAAIKIVELTFPFKGFPKEMESFSEITIIRDWQFGDQDI